MRHIPLVILLPLLLMLLNPLGAAAEQPYLLFKPPVPQQQVRLPRAPGHLSAEVITESLLALVLPDVVVTDTPRSFDESFWLVSEARKRLGAKHWALPLIYSFGQAVTTRGLHVLGSKEAIEGQEMQSDGFLVPRVRLGEIGARLQVRF